MKKTLSCITLLFIFAGITAQESTTTHHKTHTQNTEKEIVVEKNTKKNLSTTETNTLEKDICYGELSKKAFFEALIRQNDLEIDTQTNNKLAIKTTEDMINGKKNRISYSK